jgi:hypothetical protein
MIRRIHKREVSLTAILFFAVLSISAQRASRKIAVDSSRVVVADSLPLFRPDTSLVGVIRVKRPPIPASYRATIFYIYPDVERTREHSVEFTPTAIVFSDSLFDPWEAQPIYVGSNWTNDKDSAFLVNKMADGFPQGPFNWEKYLSTMQYGFAWTDSTRSDSARFEFTLDKKGRATVKLLPWETADSSCRVFEKRSTVHMTRLRQWYPARRLKNKKRQKLRNVACVAVVTLYAYDPMAGRLLPVPVITK